MKLSYSFASAETKIMKKLVTDYPSLYLTKDGDFEQIKGTEELVMMFKYYQSTSNLYNTIKNFCHTPTGTNPRIVP